MGQVREIAYWLTDFTGSYDGLGRIPALPLWNTLEAPKIKPVGIAYRPQGLKGIVTATDQWLKQVHFHNDFQLSMLWLQFHRGDQP
jgi:hypothetical protein